MTIRSGLSLEPISKLIRKWVLAKDCGVTLCLAAMSIGTMVQANVTVSQSGYRVILENDAVRFRYDLSRGQYTAIDKRDDLACIKDGVFQINDLTSSRPRLEHRWQSRDVSGELGHGKAITIRSIAPGQADLLLEITLYDGRPCIAFAGGIENTTDQPVQLKRIEPLATGTLFDGVDMKNTSVSWQVHFAHP